MNKMELIEFSEMVKEKIFFGDRYTETINFDIKSQGGDDIRCLEFYFYFNDKKLEIKYFSPTEKYIGGTIFKTDSEHIFSICGLDKCELLRKLTKVELMEEYFAKMLMVIGFMNTDLCIKLVINIR